MPFTTSLNKHYKMSFLQRPLRSAGLPHFWLERFLPFALTSSLLALLLTQRATNQCAWPQKAQVSANCAVIGIDKSNFFFCQMRVPKPSVQLTNPI
jgi:hypothetical protein